MKKTRQERRIGVYRIVESVGQGSMGDVFLAWHPELQRTVALKVLRRTVASEPSVLKRFRREGRLIAQMDHPGIARVFDLGCDAGLHYIVMEFVRGRNLQQVVQDDGPLAPEQALSIARDVAKALDHAHGYGIVHRDVKPSNIILSDDGFVRLTDFGVARLAEQETVLTQAGELIGSPAFMSPEHARGADNVDARSDLYSLGATLYVLLSGKLPFHADTLAGTIHQIVHTSPRPLETLVPGLSPSAAALVKRSMAKLPAARFQTGAQFREAVDEVLRSGPTRRAQERLPGQKPTSRAALSLRAVAGSIGVCALVGGLLFYAFDPRESSAAPDAAVAPADQGAVSTFEEPDDDDGSSRPESPDRKDERARLEERLFPFCDAVLSGDETEALGFVDPSVRANPGLVRSLRHIVESVAAMGSGVSIHHTVEMREDGAGVVLFFEQEESSRIMKFPVTWIRRDGSWFAAPEADDPGS